jgi:hypothetical protein
MPNPYLLTPETTPDQSLTKPSGFLPSLPIKPVPRTKSRSNSRTRVHH